MRLFTLCFLFFAGCSSSSIKTFKPAETEGSAVGRMNVVIGDKVHNQNCHFCTEEAESGKKSCYALDKSGLVAMSREPGTYDISTLICNQFPAAHTQRFEKGTCRFEVKAREVTELGDIKILWNSQPGLSVSRGYGGNNFMPAYSGPLRVEVSNEASADVTRLKEGNAALQAMATADEKLSCAGEYAALPVQ